MRVLPVGGLMSPPVATVAPVTPGLYQVWIETSEKNKNAIYPSYLLCLSSRSPECYFDTTAGCCEPAGRHHGEPSPSVSLFVCLFLCSSLEWIVFLCLRPSRWQAKLWSAVRCQVPPLHPSRVPPWALCSTILPVHTLPLAPTPSSPRALMQTSHPAPMLISVQLPTLQQASHPAPTPLPLDRIQLHLSHDGLQLALLLRSVTLRHVRRLPKMTHWIIHEICCLKLWPEQAMLSQKHCTHKTLSQWKSKENDIKKKSIQIKHCDKCITKQTKAHNLPETEADMTEAMTSLDRFEMKGLKSHSGGLENPPKISRRDADVKLLSLQLFLPPDVLVSVSGNKCDLDSWYSCF